MQKINPSWAAAYRDGTWITQWDATHPQAVNGEVPYRAIDWSQIETLRFESQTATVTWEIPPAPDGYYWHLRSRTWIRSNLTSQLDSPVVTAFLVVLAASGQPISDESVVYVKFWFPDGTEYETPFFNSAEAAEYGTGLAIGKPPPLKPITDIRSTTTAALLN